jgi:hypothetical protein
MEEMIATLIYAINRQGVIIREQNRSIEAVEESRITRFRPAFIEGDPCNLPRKGGIVRLQDL